MTTGEKRQALRTGILGIALTAIVLAADFAGLWAFLDNGLYDLRARTCQIFAPPPTDDLVYIDIDDQSIQALGHFPWPREILASMVDEVRRAGAKTLAFDVVFSERQKKDIRRDFDREGKPLHVEVDHDALLADACKRFGNVVIPATFGLNPTHHSPTYHLVRAALEENLELTPRAVAQILHDRGTRGVQDLEAAVNRDYPEAIREAMLNRVEREAAIASTTLTVEQLRQRLLPRTPPYDSYLLRLLDTSFEHHRAAAEFRRFARPLTSDLPPLIPTTRVLAPISALSAVASSTGYVDYIPTGDGVVRDVPLFVAYANGIYTQAGLALACEMLDIDPADPRRVHITADSVTLLPPDKPAIVIPVHPFHSTRLNLTGNAFIKIPWYGDRDWAAMYARFNKDPHLLIIDIWQLCQSRQDVSKNCKAADEAIKFVYSTISPDRLKEYESKPLPEQDLGSRVAVVASLLKELAELQYLDFYKGKQPGDFADLKDQKMVASIRAMEDVQAIAPSLLAMIPNQERYLRSRLAGKAALVGYVATAAGASDVVPTSLSPRCPGVIIHGAIFNGIMTGELWRIAPRWVSLLVTCAVGLLATSAVALLSPWKAVLATLAVLVSYLLINGVLLFDYLNILIDPGAGGVVAAIGLVFAGCTLTRLLIEGVERARITRRFRAYNDPGLVDDILAHPELERTITLGQTRIVTLVFTDLASFTTISERLGEGVVKLLNRYLDRMLPIIKAHEGLVNKFFGDGIMFVFNGFPTRTDPHHANHAVECLHAMHANLQEFNEQLAQENLPALVLRAGMATDTVILGDAGATDRSDYTALGDAVNLASRLEGANKVTGTSNLITQATADALGNRFLLRPVGKLQVLGKATAVMSYEAICPLDQANDAQREMVELTHAMVQSFGDSRFTECIQLADVLERRFGPHKLVSLYRSLSTVHLSTPPEEPFEGRIVLAEK